MIVEHQGRIRRIVDGIIVCDGLRNTYTGEIVEIYATNGGVCQGFVFDSEKGLTKIALLLGDEKNLAAGNTVCRSYKVPVTRSGMGVLGQTVTPLGECVNRGEIDPMDYFPQMHLCSEEIVIDRRAPGVTEREPVRIPFYTGPAAVDCFFPIGRGQRELIIGDNKTGKTTLTLTAIINQRVANMNAWSLFTKNVSVKQAEPNDPSGLFTPCIYVAVGQKRAEIVRLRRTLLSFDALFYTCIVFTGAETIASQQYLAPYAGSAIGEWFRDRGYHALVVYDDLSQHAVAYRQLSLLLRRPPAREAYPADIFHLHSRLSERSAQLLLVSGGGSLTALPIIETQPGDIAAYIPTNVTSITDGQIFLSRRIANSGRRPAVDFGLSVSRVGSAAQVAVMSGVSRIAKVVYPDYRRMHGIEQLGGDIPVMIRQKINRGKRLNISMTQKRYVRYNLYEQTMGLFLLSTDLFDTFDVKYTKEFIAVALSTKFARVFGKGRLRFMHSCPSLLQASLTSVSFDDVRNDHVQFGRAVRKILRRLQRTLRGNTILEQAFLENKYGYRWQHGQKRVVSPVGDACPMIAIPRETIATDTGHALAEGDTPRLVRR